MQPQKYERITDFTEREGDDTDHSALNDEFDAAALTTDQIRANLALIQRDDGALKNGIVTADALDDSAFDAVQASVNEATIEAQEAATSALTSATTANAAKDAAVVAKTQTETARDSSNLNAANAAASAAAALASKNAAAASEASALASKNAAAASETAAAGSAASASGSAATSTAQAGIATTKAGEAAASQAAAAASSGTATTKAAEASASEAAALASKNAAAASQTAAAASAATSTTKAGEASASAAAALASEVAADASEAGALASKNAAATSETNALASKNAAATSEANALTYKNQAQASQTAAAASETGAAGSASSAAASAAAAAASLDNFDDRYLGPKASAPTVDNDGNALIVGALYYNDGTIVSDNKGMWIYDGATWIKASSASQAILTTYKFIATAGQTTFSGVDSQGLTLGYQPGSALITMNGPVITIGLDVTATSGNSIVLASGAAAGDEINIYAFATFNIANTYTQAQADALLAGKVSKAGDTITQTSVSGRGLSVEKPIGSANTASTIRALGHSPSVELLNRDATQNWYVGIDDNSAKELVIGRGYGVNQGLAKAIVIDTADRVRMPSQPAFHAYRSSTMSGSGDVTGWTGTEVNIGSCFNASNGRFTAPVAGTYIIFMESIGVSGQAAADIYAAVNGATRGSVLSARPDSGATESYASNAGSCGMVTLNANDYVTMRSTQSLYSDSNNWIRFGGHLIG